MELDRAVRDLLRDGRIVALVVWDARGHAVWAHNPALVGTLAPDGNVVPDIERRRIAADLHDGVVPDLSTVALAADALARTVPDTHRPMVEHLGRSTRETISALRRLAIGVNPPNLTGAGLPGAVDGLAEPLRAEGTVVCVDVVPLPLLDRDVAGRADVRRERAGRWRHAHGVPAAAAALIGAYRNQAGPSWGPPPARGISRPPVDRRLP